jgi:tetratricopeptide (TPR) repeat protein
MNSCPSAEALEQLLDGTLPNDERIGIGAHLAGCGPCQVVLDRLIEKPEWKRWAADCWPQRSDAGGLPSRLGLEPALAGLLEKLRATPPPAALGSADTPDGPELSLGFLGPPQDPGDLGTLGPYRVQAELGRGGMGIVLRAYDPELQRTVALKVVPPDRADARARARFVREAQAAARLTDDHVVPVYAVDNPPNGPPYLVMQYVEGVTLRERIKAEGRLDPREAARIGEQAARGLVAAHRAGLVHRDMKPSNIILESATARARIMDFGLVRLTSLPGGLTQEGTVAGTPEYMSPEQVRTPERLDARTDVYSLGVTLYEALTGEVPFRGVQQMVVQQILNDEPRALRRLNDRIPRDLETICLRCLQREPGRRYHTAEALAEDLHRFLAGEPIQARPVRAWERALKWARRQPYAAALAAVSGLAVVVLFAVILGFTLQLRAALKETQDQRDRAEAREQETNRARAEEAHQRAVARAVNEFLQRDLLGQADIANQPRAAGQGERNRDITVREVLDRAAAGIEGNFRDQPEIEAAIRQTIGDAYQALGAYDKAQEQLARVVAWRQGHLGADHPETLTSKNNLALLYLDQGKYAQAEPLLKDLLEVQAVQLGADHKDTLTAKHNLAALYTQRRKDSQAKPLLEEVLQARTAKLGADHPDTLTTKHNLADVYHHQGHYAQAEALFKEALQGCTAQFGADHPDTLGNKHSLALLYQDWGKYAQAEPLSIEVLQGCTAKLGADHPNTLLSKNNLALLYQRQGKYAQAEALFKEVLRAQTAQLGADHPNTLVSKHNLANLCWEQGKYDQAEPLATEVLQARTAKFGADHPATLLSKDNLARLYQSQGKYAQAEPLLLESLDTRKQRLGADHPDVMATLASLGFNYLGQKRYAAAEPHLRAALAIYARKLPDDWRHFHTQSLLGVSLLGQKQYAAAEPLLLAGYEGIKQREARIPAQYKESLTESLDQLVQLYDAWGKPDEANQWRAELEKLPKPSEPPKAK